MKSLRPRSDMCTSLFFESADNIVAELRGCCQRQCVQAFVWLFFLSWLHEPLGRVLLYSFGKNKLGGSTESLKLGG